MLATSIKPASATMTVPVQWWPAAPTVDAYVAIWLGRPYGRYFLNSLAVASATTLVSIALAALAGYGFSRYRFRGASGLLMAMVGTQMIPSILLLITYFKVVSWVGLYNTLTALVLAYTSFVLPFTTWLMKGYFDGVPIELDEAALIDGCSPLSGFARVDPAGGPPGDHRDVDLRVPPRLERVHLRLRPHRLRARSTRSAWASPTSSASTAWPGTS